jgi:hypothetical protein
MFNVAIRQNKISREKYRIKNYALEYSNLYSERRRGRGREEEEYIQVT